MMSSVIGGAMLPHAPQFFTMPEAEDRNTVERIPERTVHAKGHGCARHIHGHPR
jgi:catalase